MKKLSLTLSAVSLISATPAFAHTGLGAQDSLSAGFTHPFLGLDHLLAMLAIGVWAMQLDRHARYLVPASFVSVMVMGAALALTGVNLSFVETGIASSVMLLGLLIGFAPRLPLAAPITLTALFALVHGYAHGSELPLSASPIAYGAGFMIATAMLHGFGLLLGYFAFTQNHRWMQRAIGAGLGAAGLAFLVVA